MCRTARGKFHGAVLLFAALLLAACGSTPRNASHAYTPLLLISIDGYRADYLARGLSPNLSALADHGVHAAAMRSAFPTLTFPNHYTIVTGLYPDHTGIVNNRFVDPSSGAKFVYNDPKTTADPAWWGGEPLWVTAERQGKHAATMFWPGSDVPIQSVRPAHWLPFDGKIPPDARVDQVLAWLDLPAAERPEFVTLYFDQVDHAGHDFGPDSVQVSAALRQVDSAVARLVDGLRQRRLLDSTNIVVVSDHGMTPSGPERVIVLDDLIDLQHLDLVNAGVLAGITAKPGYEQEIESALLTPHEHMHCWKKEAVPARLHYGSNPRIPALLCLANDGWQVTTREYLARPNHHISLGEHGYDNDDPNMRALFVAHGPAFRHHLEIPQFDNVDLYPLLARLLGLRPAPNDGDARVLLPVLAQGSH